MPLTIVHFTTDSLPRVVTGSAGTSALDVLLPFRVDLDDPALSVTGWHLDVEVDGRSWQSRVRARRLRAGLADALRERMARMHRRMGEIARAVRPEARKDVADFLLAMAEELDLAGTPLRAASDG